MPPIKILKALADEKRLQIVTKLLHSDLCVGALARHLGVSKPAVSQHLRVLRKAGLVSGEKRGYWTHYTVDRPALIRLAAELNRLAAEASLSTAPCRRISTAPGNPSNEEQPDMCRNRFQQPARLKGKPENRSSEHIAACHGDAKVHPCTPRDRGPCSE
jgi:DNA-binding transcriptional ArsR family regulator